jgi:regulatory protein
LTGSWRARGSRSLPGSRARPGEGEDLGGASAAPSQPAGGGDKPRGTPWDRALRLLSVRDRSRRELERRLLMAGFEEAEVQGALERLESAGLVDDRRFARTLAEHQTGARLAGRRAVMAALMAKGVDRQTAETVLEDTGDEEERARTLAERRAGRLGGLPPQVAHRRLTDFLIRRGHAPGTAREAASRALGINPEGS